MKVQLLMRALHRDIGYLLIGFTLIYAFSGIVMIFRGDDFLRFDQQFTETFAPNLSEEALLDELPFREINISENNASRIVFEEGYYEKATGKAVYTAKKYPEFISRMNDLHRSTKGDATYIVSVIVGVLLIFLAISSFWMYKPNTRLFNRGILLTIIGFITAVVILLMT